MTIKQTLGSLPGLAAALAMAGCSPEQGRPAPGESALASTTAKPARVMSPDLAAHVRVAVASPARTQKDRNDDAARQPAMVLAFAGIAPGMTVFEMEAGSGYYTELLSTIVGPSGRVIMQNPASFDTFLGDSVSQRLADGRLANVRLSKTLFDHLDAPDGSVDVVTWFLGPHELYYTPEDGQSLGQPTAVFGEIFRVLKPGGTLVVLDHAAAAGAPADTGNSLHRIDPAIVNRLAKQGGFSLVQTSNGLANGQDDHTLRVFDPKVRRKTDRFLLRFAKPA